MSLQKYSDTEADFWKEHFVHLQHKNMVRTNALPLRLRPLQPAILMQKYPVNTFHLTVLSKLPLLQQSSFAFLFRTT